VIPTISPIPNISCVGDVIARNAVVQSLESASSKPSFLLWDKVYEKISDPEEAAWLIRAIEATLTHSGAELDKNSSLRYVLFTPHPIEDHLPSDLSLD
jgi:hypothetical protein